MKCPNCGKINDDGFRFCQYCGTPTSNSVPNLQKVVNKPDLIPQSQMSTPSPSTVDSWFNPSAATSDNPQFSNDPAERIKSQLDLPLSSIEIPLDTLENSNLPVEEDQTVPDDLSKLRALAPKADHSPKPAKGDRICLNCGSVVSKGNHFCGNCGAKYNSDYELTPIIDKLVDLASEANAPKRQIERVSFVNNFVVPAGQDNANFTLFHVNDDGTLGDQILLNAGENIIGKSSSVQLNNDRFVSPKHLRIICHKDKAVIEDYGSLNGVFIRLSDKTAELCDGDSFRIGEELLCYSHGKSKQQLLATKDDSTELLGSKEPECWGYLRLILGPFSEGNVYRLYDNEVFLGRTNADILFPKDGFVSGRHLKLTAKGDHATITDLNSSNGTFVKLRGSMTVTGSEFILLGNQLLRLKIAPENK